MWEYNGVSVTVMWINNLMFSESMDFLLIAFLLFVVNFKYSYNF